MRQSVKELAALYQNNLFAAAIACAVVIGAGGTAYAADLGGIQEKISMWLYGAQTEVDVTETGENGYGGYSLTQTENPTADSNEKYSGKTGYDSPSENTTESDTSTTTTTYTGIIDNK